MNKLRDKKLGTLVGLAVGDAMGAPYEFLDKSRYTPTREYNTGGAHNVSVGEWTDDTSMALCLAQSLIDCKGFDAKDQMEKYLKWYAEGYMSTRGKCFDIGNATRNAIIEFDNTGRKIRKTKTGNFQTNGNGTIMRLAPIVIKYFEDDKLLDYATNSSLTTHRGIEAHQSACLLAEIIRNCYLETDKIKILENTTNVFNNNFIKDIIEEYHSSCDEVFYPTIPTGYCIDTLRCAIQGFLYCDNFIDGLLYCISLGDDTDTVGAVYGQIAGAYYGLSGIPDYYRENLQWYDKILEIGNELIGKDLSGCVLSGPHF